MRQSPFTLACALALLGLWPVATQALTSNEAVDQHFEEGYPQRLEQTITGFKAVPLGFRWLAPRRTTRPLRVPAPRPRLRAG